MKTAIRIGKWTFYPKFGRFLNEDGTEYFLDKRLNKLLRMLLEKNGAIIKRDEILEFVWDEVQVNEENLTKGIFDLRKFLKEKEIKEIQIQTIRNIGYRLTYNIEEDKPPRSIIKTAFKSLGYIVIVLLFLIMLIRAINY